MIDNNNEFALEIKEWKTTKTWLFYEIKRIMINKGGYVSLLNNNYSIND